MSRTTGILNQGVPASGAGRNKVLALISLSCLLLNIFYPRSILELKDNSLIWQIMENQAIFLNLFSFSNRISVDIMKLLLAGKTVTPHASDTKQNGGRSAAHTNPSSDFSFINPEKRNDAFRPFSSTGLSLGGLFTRDIRSPVVPLSGAVPFSESPLFIYALLLLLLMARARDGIEDAIANFIDKTIRTRHALPAGFYYFIVNIKNNNSLRRQSWTGYGC